MTAEQPKKWIEYLGEEDISFIKRFILHSGSLKDLAEIYGVSYPTIRLRLDRLIAKVEALNDAEIVSEFERVLRAKCADGKLDPETMRDLLRVHRKEKGGKT